MKRKLDLPAPEDDETSPFLTTDGELIDGIATPQTGDQKMKHRPKATFTSLEEAVRSLSLPDLCHFWMELTGTSETEIADQTLELLRGLNKDEIKEMLGEMGISIGDEK